MLSKVTPLILTFNEAPNIGRVLDKLDWAQRIVVIDSFSTDETISIVKVYPQVEVFQRKFDSFASQCNWGLSKIQSEWVLSLDSDYVLSDALVTEITHLELNSQINAYRTHFKYCIFGYPLRGTLLPPRTILYRRCKAIYQNDGHAHRVVVEGEISLLRAFVYHDDRKPLNRWLWAQDRYMVLEVQKLLTTPTSELSFGDRIRKTKILSPFAIFIYSFILKGCILDGWVGWYYTLQRVLVEMLLCVHLIQAESDMQSNKTSQSVK